MVAIATLPRFVPAPARRAPLRLVDAERRVAPAPVSLGRLLATALAAFVVLAAVALLVRADPGPVAGELRLLDETHQVVAGETMWSIANDVAPAGEAAGYVERLVDANGTASVAAGQVLVLPVP